MPGSARPCSTGLPIRLTLSKQVRSRTAFAEPCERNVKSDPRRPLFHSASASPSGLRSSRTELYPLNLQRPRVGQIKPPKWAKPTCQKQEGTEYALLANKSAGCKPEQRSCKRYFLSDFGSRLLDLLDPSAACRFSENRTDFSRAVLFCV